MQQTLRETTALFEQVFSVTYDPSGNGGRGSFFFNPDGEVPAATPHVAACSGTLVSVESLRVACYGAFSCTLAEGWPHAAHSATRCGPRQAVTARRAISRRLCLCVRATAYAQRCHVAISLLDRSHCARCPRAHA